MSVPFAYRVLPDGKLFAVVCIHDETPDWWHVVARFADKDRADRYAEVEGDCVADNFAADPVWEGDERPAPVAELPAPPPTKVKPENFRPPSPAEKARVGAALIGDAARETGTAVEVRAIEAPPISVAARTLPAKGVEAARQTASPPDDTWPTNPHTKAVWRAVVEFCDSGKDLKTTPLAAAAKVNPNSLAYYVNELEKKGFITGYGRGGLAGIEILRRPDDMPVPEKAAIPPPAPPRPTTQVFTRAASTPARAASASLPGPAEVSLKDVIRFLAKDVQLFVAGPDDDDCWRVGNESGLDADGVLAVANKWRARRNEPPFRLVEAAEAG